MPEIAQGQAPGPGQGPARQTRIDGISRVIAVASCKGGVGKSTVAVNLACALAAEGKKVGLADMDIYGPSAPIMLGISGQPKPSLDGLIPPLEAHGLSVVSMGFFLDDAAPVIWRGPMAMSATKQFLRGVRWGKLDYLVVDLPPGTGDIVLTLCQEIPIDGAVIVTTPQDVALDDVRRGIAMFRRVNAPVLGVVENMSGYTCPGCGHRDDIFGTRRGDQLAAELGLPLLGEIPIEEAVRVAGDEGAPIVVRDPRHPATLAFLDSAAKVVAALDRAESQRGAPEPVDISGDKDNRVVRIQWSDGVVTHYRMSGLRGWCPCAQCQGHSGRRGFVEIDDPVLSTVEGVGRYAVRFIWVDGHSTGMYSYSYLRELADLPECKLR
jgi:ATP-binding protein involved in chromosome partitioning